MVVVVTDRHPVPSVADIRSDRSTRGGDERRHDNCAEP